MLSLLLLDLFCIGSVILSSRADQVTFEGQYADLLFGNIDQAYVAPRAQKVIQLLDSTHAVLSGCDDGVTWWGNILANITNDGRTMYVDFSPKGGPSSVQANLTTAGHITWSGNNFWERTSYWSSFEGDYTSVFSGSTLPNFPTTFQSVSIGVEPLIAPNYHTTTATISSPVWPAGVTVTGSISYNVLTADFSAVGGPSYVLANLTQSGDVQWLVAENMWQRDLCSASCDSDNEDSDDDLIFTQNISFSIVCFIVTVLAVSGSFLFCMYRMFSKPSNSLLAN
mmetsp:Transcript_119538/g.234966  ORF Transcript_119538/g.234966 Transcript_119538/m.234966 type:complete len:282 (+) Transcript_119538:83-928(+)